MLTPEAIAALRSSAGLNPVPPAPTQKGSTDILAQRKAALEGDTTTTDMTDTTSSLGDQNEKSIQKRGVAMEADLTSTEGNSDNPFVQGAADLSHGVKATGEAFGAVTDIAGNVVNSLFKHLGINTQDNPPPEIPGNFPVKNFLQSTGSKAYDELGIRLNDFITQHPEVGKAIESVLRTGQGAGDTAGGILTADAAATGAQKTVDLTKQGLEKGKEVAGNVKDAVMNKVTGSTGNPVQDSIDAVNPDLSGKKLTSAYKQTVTGQRDVVPSSIFKEQGLTPSEQTTNLGTRLSDLGLGKDPVENLNKLSTALQDTETKVTEALKANPDIPTERDTLLETLDKGKTEALPREFKGIKDSSNAFQDVIDFGKETINNSPDSFEGLRDARTQFDTQAKLEYPNAFKDGMIDVKTPAGRAIKFVRDSMNEHLYNVAPNGSDIQKLIGREADIFRATDAVAPKAAATHGMSGIEKAVENSKVLKTGKDIIKKAIPMGLGTHL